ncbi:uncharacterized protein TNCV_3810651 [Trichonephila clavipes]|nr:uncharacterized protein TNCV_3810651 [Trichonephila clavipes]
MSTEPGKLIGIKLSFQVNHASIRMATFVLDAMPVSAAFQSVLSNNTRDLTPGVMVSGAISYQGRSNLIQIVGNHNSNRYVREVLLPEVVLFLQGIP